MIAEIAKLSTDRVGWIAKYITYRATEQIVFGKDVTTVAEFCKDWEGLAASTFIVKVWAGPPKQQNWYKMQLHQFVLDWYFSALAGNNRHMVKKFEDMLG